MGDKTKFLKNTLPDYTGNVSHTEKEEWKKYVMTMANECATKQPVNSRNIDGGLYLGTTGIAYMFYHLSESPAFQNERSHLLNKASEIIENTRQVSSKHHSNDPSDRSSFILGDAGFHAVCAAISHSKGDERSANEHVHHYNDAAATLKPINCYNFGGDELFVGRAGYICGGLWLNKIFKKQVVSEENMKELCKSIVESGLKSAKEWRTHIKSPLIYSYYDTVYLGAAHGLSSILQMLLSSPFFMKAVPPNTAEDVYRSVDALLELQDVSGNFPCADDEVRRNSQNNLVHWCHGAPGIVYLMAKAYLNTNDKKYLSSCIKCGDVTWEKGLLKKGPGICHGVAGSGYVHLLLYRLTNNEKYLHRAIEFAKFMQTKEFLQARTPDHPFSLYEGKAGTVCFLADLLSPETSAFPFMDVF